MRLHVHTYTLLLVRICHARASVPGLAHSCVRLWRHLCLPVHVCMMLFVRT